MNEKEIQLFDAIDMLTHHLTTSIGEIVEVLGQISETLGRIDQTILEIRENV